MPKISDEERIKEFLSELKKRQKAMTSKERAEARRALKELKRVFGVKTDRALLRRALAIALAAGQCRD